MALDCDFDKLFIQQNMTDLNNMLKIEKEIILFFAKDATRYWVITRLLCFSSNIYAQSMKRAR